MAFGFLVRMIWILLTNLFGIFLLSYKACCFSQFFCVLGDWVLSGNESSFVVLWVFLNYRFFFWVCCCSDIASQQQDEIDDALKMGVLRSSGHSYLWVRFRV
jgi:hypothetical protein